MKIILATSSASRIKSFGLLGYEFDSKSSRINEQFSGRPTDPIELVSLLAKMKAEKVAETNVGVIIGFDTIGVHKGVILEKPLDKKQAYERIKMLSGETFESITGVHMINTENKKTTSKVSVSKCKLRYLTDSEIKDYLEEDDNCTNIAVGFEPLNYSSASFIEKVEGSINGVGRGIPIEIIPGMLRKVI